MPIIPGKDKIPQNIITWSQEIEKKIGEVSTYFQGLINNLGTIYARRINVIEKDNTTVYTPASDYNPSTKKYVDDTVISGGGTVFVKLSQTIAQTIGTTAARLLKLWATDITCSNPIDGSVTGSSGSCTGTAAGDLHLDQTTPQSVINGSPIMEGLQFDITPSTSNVAEGLLRWNNTDGTLDLGMGLNGIVTQQVGQELFIKVVNKTGVTITEGSAVYFNGRQGTRPTIALAKSDSDTTSYVAGVVTENIIDNAEGFITTFGYVRKIKTDYATWAENDTLWVSKTTAGALTNVEPTAPNHADIVGSVGVVHATQGSILVKIERHKTLSELSDVDGTPLTVTGQIPVWDNTRGLFDFTSNILTGYVPYTGANADVNIGAYDLTTTDLRSSGQGYFGTSTPNATYRVHISNNSITEFGRTALFEGRTTSATALVSPFALKMLTSANMTDGFGAGMLFAIQDNANVENFISRISAFRSGADNSGILSLGTYLNGTLGEGLRILNNGNILIGGQTTDATFKMDIKSITINFATVFTGTGLNDFNSTSTTYTGNDIVNPTYTITCDGTGATDTFKWKKNSGAETTGVNFSTTFITLTDGIRVAWTSKTGHTIGDQWVVTVTVANPLQLLTAAGKKFIVNNAGNVGIGVASATAITNALHVSPVSGVTAGQTVFIQDGTSTTGSTKLVLKSGDGQSTNPLLEIQNAIAGVKASISETVAILPNTSIVKYDASNYMTTAVASNNAVTITNNTAADVNLNCGTDKTLVLTETVWEDLNFDPARSGGPIATRPDEVTINNVFHKEFTSLNNQLCGATQELPHEYKLSSALAPHCHIFLKSGESSGTTGVTFTVYWELRQSTGTTSGSVTLSATSVQLASTAGGNKLSLYDATFAGSAELGGQLSLVIARTAGDAGDVIVTTYGVHYEIDTMGSRQSTAK